MVTQFEVAHRVSVAPDRLAGWVERFEARHGQLDSQVTPNAILLQAANGARARLVNQWEPIPANLDLAAALQHLAVPRCFGLILVRKGASAVAMAEGDELVAHRVSRHYVQGRAKAGGWSQQRYARRRANQARSAYQRAADDAFDVLVPLLPRMSALVTGGDRVGLVEVLTDARLAGLARLPQRHPVLAVPEARLTVAADAARQARAIPIELDALARSGGAVDRPAPQQPPTP